MEKAEKRTIQQMSKVNFSKLLKNLADQNKPDLCDEAIRIYCEKNFEAFCEIFFPHYAKHPWNKFHRDCFEFYNKKKEPARTVDCAPRGYAKSTIKTLFKPVHDIAYGTQRYILFIAATTKQSGEKLKDIRSEIYENDLLCRIYGLHFSTKKVGAEAFEVHTPTCTIFLRSVSAGTSVRGLRYKEHRPTKIILDDAEDSEDVLNEDIREKTSAWFREDISKLGSEVTDIEIVGTVLHRDSLLMELKRNPAYTTKIYQAVVSWADNGQLWEKWRTIYNNLDNAERALDANAFYVDNQKAMLEGTEVLWPAREDYLSLMKEREEIGHRAFMKEKQNLPMPSSDALFDNLWFYSEGKNDEGEEGFIIEKTGAFIPKRDVEAYAAMDPATGTSKTGNKSKLDFTSIVSGYKDLKGRLFVHHDYTKRAKPTDYIQQIFEFHDMFQYEKFALETNLYRGLLLENIIREKRKIEAQRKKDKVKNWGLRIPFYEIENREKKTERIFTLEPKINNGWILFNKALSFNFMEQVTQFPSKDIHDDAPDALEMLWGLVNNRYQSSPIDLKIVGSR